MAATLRMVTVQGTCVGNLTGEQQSKALRDVAADVPDVQKLVRQRAVGRTRRWRPAWCLRGKDGNILKPEGKLVCTTSHAVMSLTFMRVSSRTCRRLRLLPMA